MLPLGDLDFCPWNVSVSCSQLSRSFAVWQWCVFYSKHHVIVGWQSRNSVELSHSYHCRLLILLSIGMASSKTNSKESFDPTSLNFFLFTHLSKEVWPKNLVVSKKGSCSLVIIRTEEVEDYIDLFLKIQDSVLTIPEYAASFFTVMASDKPGWYTLPVTSWPPAAFSPFTLHLPIPHTLYTLLTLHVLINWLCINCLCINSNLLKFS